MQPYKTGQLIKFREAIKGNIVFCIAVVLSHDKNYIGNFDNKYIVYVNGTETDLLLHKNEMRLIE